MRSLSLMAVGVLISLSAGASQLMDPVQDVRLNLLAAQQDMLTALQLPNINLGSLSPDQAALFTQNQAAFVDELKNLSLDLQSEKTEAFQHFGQSTWFETDVQVHGQIRVRGFAQMIADPEYGPAYDIRFLSHEIAHHILSPLGLDVTPEIEAKVVQLGALFAEMVSAQSPIEGLMNVALGDYQGSVDGCHDVMRITNIDPWKGTIALSLSEPDPNSHCRTDLQAVQESRSGLLNSLAHLFSKPVSPYIFDHVDFQLQCKSDGQEITCVQLLNPQLLALCPRLVEIEKKDLASGETPWEDVYSVFKIRGGVTVESEISWCLQENRMMSRSNTENKLYAKPNQ